MNRAHGDNRSPRSETPAQHRLDTLRKQNVLPPINTPSNMASQPPAPGPNGFGVDVNSRLKKVTGGGKEDGGKSAGNLEKTTLDYHNQHPPPSPGGSSSACVVNSPVLLNMAPVIESMAQTINQMSHCVKSLDRRMKNMENLLEQVLEEQKKLRLEQQAVVGPEDQKARWGGQTYVSSDGANAASTSRAIPKPGMKIKNLLEDV